MVKRTINGRTAEIEDGVVEIVDAINEFDGLTTTESCEGHGGEAPAAKWFVALKPDHSEQGWCALEFLTWAVSDYCRGQGVEIALVPRSAPPYLNDPGRTMYFSLTSVDADAEKFAEFLRSLRERCYLGPEMSDEEVERKIDSLFDME